MNRRDFINPSVSGVVQQRAEQKQIALDAIKLLGLETASDMASKKLIPMSYLMQAFDVEDYGRDILSE